MSSSTSRSTVRIPALALIFGCAIVSGCANSGPTPDPATNSTRQPHPAATAAPTSAPIDPCAGTDRCREVASVDVDGDGALDRVGIGVVQSPPPPQVAYGAATVSVIIAVGPDLQRIDVTSPGVLPGTSGKPDPYVGAYLISRKTGADLVLHTQLGQGNSEQFVVIGWQSGHPELVSAPPSGIGNPAPGVWYIGSSHGVHEWVSCSDGAAVTFNRLSAPTAEGIPLPGGGIREENFFSYDGVAWSPSGSNNVADDSFSYDFAPHTDTFRCEDQARHK